MSKIAIIVGHARTGTFCEALGEAYLRGALAGGHHGALFVTSRMTFDPILHDGFARVQPLEADLAAAHDAMMAADHLVVIFPLWLGTLPALFKGFLERVLQPDLVEPSREGKFPQLLAGKSVRIVMTMGMPGLIYRWWYGAHALHMLKGNILGFIGAGPIRSTIYGMVEAVGSDRRARWLAEMEALGRSGR